MKQIYCPNCNHKMSGDVDGIIFCSPEKRYKKYFLFGECKIDGCHLHRRCHLCRHAWTHACKKELNPSMIQWTYNVADKYKGLSTEQIKADLKSKAFPSAILMSHINGDFNLGSVIRAANNFNFSKIYYFGGKKHYDKRAACGTFNYSDVIHLKTFDDVKNLKSKYHFVGLDNNINRNVQQIKNYSWKEESMIIVGEEGFGIPNELLDICDDYVEIPSLGSVRSLNVACASSIAMYDYARKHMQL